MRSFNSYFKIFVAPIGHSLKNRMCLGILKEAISPTQKSFISSSVAVSPGFSSTNATGTSPYFSSSSPTTALSLIFGCVAKKPSISTEATFSPPTFNMSFNLPRKDTLPCSSIEPRSPLKNQPSESKDSSVFVASLW